MASTKKKPPAPEPRKPGRPPGSGVKPDPKRGHLHIAIPRSLEERIDRLWPDRAKSKSGWLQPVIETFVSSEEKAREEGKPSSRCACKPAASA